MERLAKLLSVSESVAYTCETAAHFWLLHVLARWEKFAAQCAAAKTPGCVKGEAGLGGAADGAICRRRPRAAGGAWQSSTDQHHFRGRRPLRALDPARRHRPPRPPPRPAELFPFADFFADAPQPLFGGESYEADWEKAQVGGAWGGAGGPGRCGGTRPTGRPRPHPALCVCARRPLRRPAPAPPPLPQGCFRHLRTMFRELEEIRPFELLKSSADRVNYLVTKQVRRRLACNQGAGGG